MKAMIVSDFAVLRSALLQLLGICAIIALFMGYVMGAVDTAAAIAAMVPFMGLFSLAAYDEQNNWERFRLTLPLTRRQVVVRTLCLHRPPYSRILGPGPRAGPGNCGPGRDSCRRSGYPRASRRPKTLPK